MSLKPKPHKLKKITRQQNKTPESRRTFKSFITTARKIRKQIQQLPTRLTSDTDIERSSVLQNNLTNVTREALAQLNPQKKINPYGLYPYKIVGGYAIFAENIGSTHFGTTEKRIVAIHTETGIVRERRFERHMKIKPWMEVLSLDNGTLSETAWKEKLQKDALQRRFKELEI